MGLYGCGSGTQNRQLLSASKQRQKVLLVFGRDQPTSFRDVMSLKGKHQKCHSHTHQKMPSNCPTLIRRGMFPFQPWSFLTQVRFFEGQILNCILESLQVSSLWKPKLSGNLSFVTCQCVQPHLPKDFSHQTRNGNNHRCTWLALGRDTEAF